MAAIYQSSFLKRADQVCDYIPLVSTVSNLVNLFQKYVVFPRLEQGQPLEGSRFVYHAHLKDKSFLKCILLSIPVLGTIFAFIFAKMRPQNVFENIGPLNAGEVTISGADLKGVKDERGGASVEFNLFE